MGVTLLSFWHIVDSMRDILFSCWGFLVGQKTEKGFLSGTVMFILDYMEDRE